MGLFRAPFSFLQMIRVWFIIDSHGHCVQYYHSRRSPTAFSLLADPRGPGCAVPVRVDPAPAAMAFRAAANRMPVGARLIGGRSAGGGVVDPRPATEISRPRRGVMHLPPNRAPVSENRFPSCWPTGGCPPNPSRATANSSPGSCG